MDKEKWKIFTIALTRGIVMYCIIFTIDFYIQSFQNKIFVPYWPKTFILPYIIVHAWFLRPKAKNKIEDKKDERTENGDG